MAGARILWIRDWSRYLSRPDSLEMRTSSTGHLAGGSVQRRQRKLQRLLMRQPRHRKRRHPQKRKKANQAAQEVAVATATAEAEAEAAAEADVAKDKDKKAKEAQKGKAAGGSKRGTLTIAQQAQDTELPQDLDAWELFEGGLSEGSTLSGSKALLEEYPEDEANSKKTKTTNTGKGKKGNPKPKELRQPQDYMCPMRGQPRITHSHLLPLSPTQDPREPPQHHPRLPAETIKQKHPFSPKN